MITDLLQKQAEIGTQLNEKLKARAQEFSALAAEVQDSVGSFTADAAGRAADTANRAAAESANRAAAENARAKRAA